MKVVYFYSEGEPEQVLEALKAFTDQISKESAPVVVNKYEEPEYEGPTLRSGVILREEKEKIPGESIAQDPEETACRFCVRYTGSGKRLERHEMYCRKNPNPALHPLKGRPTPWLKRKSKVEVSSSERSEEPVESLTETASDSIDSALDSGEVGI